MVHCPRRRVPAWAACALATVFSGCAFAPRQQLEDCRQRALALQAEVSRQKDEALTLRSQNRDFARRAVDDAHRMRALEQENGHLERSVTVYQDERERISQAFEEFRRQVQLAADPPTTAMLERFESFARAHPGTQFDAQRGTWDAPAELIFKPGTSEFTREGRLLVEAFARLLPDRDAPARPVGILGAGALDPVRRVANAPLADALGEERARRVRDVLAGKLAVAPASIDALAAPIPDGAAPRAEEIAIRIVPQPKGVDGGATVSPSAPRTARAGRVGGP